MSFQTRIFVAVALCALIFIVFDFINPKPPPEELEEQTSAELEGSEAGADGEAEAVDAEGKTPEAEAPEAAEPEAEAAEPEQDIEVATHVIHNEWLELEVTNASPGRKGMVQAVRLLSSQFEGHATADDSLGLQERRTLEVLVTDEDGRPLVPKGAAYELTKGADGIDWDDRVVLSHRGEDVQVAIALQVHEGYEAELDVKVTNAGGKPIDARVEVVSRIGDSDSRYDIRRGVCRTDEDVEDEDKTDLDEGPIRYDGPIAWGGADGKYFTTLVVPSTPAARCIIAKSDDGAALENRLVSAAAGLDPGASETFGFGLYMGAKELDRLKVYSLSDSVVLEEAIDWGFFGGVSEWLGKLLLALLRWFHGLIGAWGWSIVALTIVVKGATLPLTLKQMSSMKRMKEIQPEMAKIKEKYADDRAKQGQEMQALFARSGVNPLAGCFPMLVQLPIWFALYSMLGTAVELVHEPFLWLPDLTEQDPFYALPLALGALMIVQQNMMPSTMDAAQAKIMRWVMPIMFTVFMLFLPSGLGVYIFANIVLSLIQTAIQVGTNKKAEAAAG